MANLVGSDNRTHRERLTDWVRHIARESFKAGRATYDDGADVTESADTFAGKLVQTYAGALLMLSHEHADSDRWTFVRRRLDAALRLADGPYERCSAELDAMASDIEKRLRTGQYKACADCGSYTCEGTHMVRE